MSGEINRWVSACAVLAGVTAIAYGVFYAGAAPEQPKRGPRSRVVLEQVFPKMDGARLEATLVEVVHGPGGSSAPHRHPCPVIGYVIEGAVRMQIKGQPERIYRRGEAFFEPPEEVHLVSANVSDREPARFIAFIVCDHQTPLTVPVTEGDPKRQ